MRKLLSRLKNSIISNPDSVYGLLLRGYSPFRYAKKYNKPIYFQSSNNNKGKALLSYIIEPFRAGSQEQALNTHANYWATWEIVRILNEMGYDVDVIEASNIQFIPQSNYSLVIGTLDCLDRFAPYLKNETIKIFYALGVYVDLRNGPGGELGRIQALENRRNCYYTPKRLFRDPEMIRRSVDVADTVIISGGKTTIESFPPKVRAKSIVCTIPVEDNTLYKKRDEDLIPQEREFVWFFGYGQVHKGLDLVIEVFIKLQGMTLNIIGAMEQDFYLAYEYELNELENIHFHGFLNTKGEHFKKIMDRSFCFIAPSVNEGISPACISMMKTGLFPIISKGTGIDLPEGLGLTLEHDTINCIHRSIETVYSFSDEALSKQISKLRQFSMNQYSAVAFTHQFTRAVKKAIE